MQKMIPLLALALFLFSNFIHKDLKKPALTLSKEETEYDFNATFLKNFTFGHKRMISSALWAQTLMQSDLEHYKDNDLNSWMFLRFKTISILDPNFYENYLFGGVYLSIVKDDILGAEEIYSKGLTAFPNDFKLNYNAAFNANFELGRPDLAIPRYEKIIDHPEGKKHPFLKTNFAKIKAMKAGPQVAFDLLYPSYNKMEAGFIKSRYHLILYDLKEKADLQCLENNEKNCSPLDFNGNKYTEKKGAE